MQNYTQELRKLRKIIGGNIHHRRIERHMTLHTLSRLTGIHVMKLDQYEMGKNQIRLEDMFQLAKLLQTNFENLLAHRTPQ